MKITMRIAPYLMMVMLSASSMAFGQDNSYQHLGTEQFKAYSGSDIDQILPFTGNLYVRIPMRSFPQKGTIPLNFFLQSNNGSWEGETECDDFGGCVAYYTNRVLGVGPYAALLGFGGIDANIKFGSSLDVSWVDTTYSSLDYSAPCDPTVGCSQAVQVAGFVIDNTGARHVLGFAPDNETLRANDGSGWVLGSVLGDSMPLIDGNGITYSSSPDGGYTVTDPNKHTILREGSDWSGQIIDTLSQTIPDVGSLVPVSDTTGCPNINVPNEPTTSSAKWIVPGKDGSSETYLFCFTSVAISTNFFGLHGGHNNTSYEAEGTVTDIQSVVLPDKTHWAFIYDTATATHPDSYGDLLQITFPTGGTISYQYDNISACAAYAGLTRGVISRTADNANGTVGAWAYTPGATATIRDPANNDTVFVYDQSHGEGCIPAEIDRRYYQGSQSSGKLLKEIVTQNQWVQDPAVASGAVTNVLPSIVTTTTPAGSFAQNYGYDVQSQNEDYIGYYNLLTSQLGGSNVINSEQIAYQMPTSTLTYDYSGGLLKSTKLVRQVPGTRAALSASPYYQANLLNLVSSITQSDQSSQFQMLFGYDEQDLGPNCVCGNQTSHSVVDPAGKAPANRWTTTYDPTGLPINSTDANQNAGAHYPGGTTSYSYDSDGLFVAQTSYPSTSGVAHQIGQHRDIATGKVETEVGQNKESTDYFYYPNGEAFANRLQLVKLPDGGSISYTYTDTPGSFLVGTARPMSAVTGANYEETVALDGFGRVLRLKRSDPYCDTGVIETDTAYDAFGRVSSKSNPYCHITDGSYDVITYHYDALGRVILETHKDGTGRHWCYDGQVVESSQTNCTGNRAGVGGDWVDYSDESGVYRQTTYDPLGRLVGVVEPASATNAGSKTGYSWNALDLLTKVTQQPQNSGAAQYRYYSYDIYGHLFSATNPESGTMYYSQAGCPGACATSAGGYDPNGNLVRKVDARGVITNYSYDALGRLVSTTYSGSDDASSSLASGTPSACYQYDTSTLGSGSSNLIGRLSNEWTIHDVCAASVPSAGYLTKRSILTYTPLGQVQSERQCTPSNCAADKSYSLTYGYDYLGNKTLYDNGIGSIAFTQQYDISNRLQSITSTWTDASHPAGIFNVQSYGPAGIDHYTLGDGIDARRTYDLHMRLSGETVLGSQ
jgi:YD repeat-containing protein